MYLLFLHFLFSLLKTRDLVLKLLYLVLMLCEKEFLVSTMVQMDLLYFVFIILLALC